MQLEYFNNLKPDVHYIPEFDPKPSTDWYGIKALWYEGAHYREKKTKVFAYIGYPKVAEGEKVPAVVLVHGGGGHAYPEWIRQWNARGFAAIAMDTTGYIPAEEYKGIEGTEVPPDETVKYVHELYGTIEEDGYTLGPDNSQMRDCDLPLEDQWMYHAVADTIIAHNILINDDKVDTDKIGIVGISWGAVILSIAIGYDNRYAFACPFYGSAHLDYQPAPATPRVFCETQVKKLWSAADRLHRVDFPVLWKCWTYDTDFSIGANSLSYLATKKSHSCLSISFDMGHSHYCGWVCEDIYGFAKRVLEGKVPLILVDTEPEGFVSIDFEVTIPEDFKDVSAEIYYLTEPIEYDEKNNMIKEWKGVPAKIYGNCVIGDIPRDAYCYFVQIKGYADGVEYVTDSALVSRKVNS